MKVVNVHDAQIQLAHLINQALAGEEVIIAQGNAPGVRLVPVDPGPRDLGWAKG
jgi:prevent-host-death family protein